MLRTARCFAKKTTAENQVYSMLHNVQPKSCLSVDFQHSKRALMSVQKTGKVTQNLHKRNQAMQVIDFVGFFTCVCIEWE
jgi:hypothetical protein